MSVDIEKLSICRLCSIQLQEAMPATVVSLNLNLNLCPYRPIRQSISASFNESFLKAASKLSQVQLYLTPPPECGAAGTARLDTPRSDCIAVVPAEC